MNEGLARAIAIGSIVLTVASLGFAVVFARRQSKIRVGFDLARSLIAVTAILVMAAVTNVSTSTLAVLLAVGGGLVLGFGQGANLAVSRTERGFYAKRNPTAIALWGIGIVIMQAAGLASRAGVVRLGQTMAWFSACLGIGVMAGRTGPIKRTATGVGVAGVITALALPGAAFLATTETLAVAQTTVTAEELCKLGPPGAVRSIPRQAEDITQLILQYSAESTVIPAGVIGPECTLFYGPTGETNGNPLDSYRLELIQVSEVSDPFGTELAQVWASGMNRIVGASGGQVPIGDFGYSGRVDYSTGDHRFEIVTGRGSFVLHGWAFAHIGATRERLEELAREFDTAIQGAAVPDTPTTTTAPDTTGVTTQGVTDTTRDSADAASPSASESTSDAEERIDPEDAAAQAIAGLIAAAAIGLITWAEAAARIADVTSTLPTDETPTGGSPNDLAPRDEDGFVDSGFVDPLDGKPLKADPATGMVFWPWDGSGGRWVDRSDVPRLIDEWNRELDAETARRVGRHNSQADADWKTTRDRIRRADAEDARRRAADKARTEAFDRYLGAARKWMENGDAASLGVLDRIAARVAAQGFATDADIADARRVANDARIYWDTMQRMNEDDWARMDSNQAAIIEFGTKTIAGLIDPTMGVATGAIFGAGEAIYDGKSAAAVIGNGALQAGLGRISAAIGGWAPGKEAVGTIAWGAGSNAATSAGAVLVTGGTWDQAWDAGKIGFVSGGLSGGVERIHTWAQGPPQGVPRIVSHPDGPRVVYDTPLDPHLRPPERGGVGAMSDRVPVIRVRPGGPRPHYDQPLSPRHVDPDDPRYIPPGAHADHVHTPPSDWSKPPPEIVEPSGPLDGRHPTPPPRVSAADALEPPPPPKVVETSGPLDGRPSPQPPRASPAGAAGAKPPPPGTEPDVSVLPGNWGKDPTTYLGGMETDPPPTPKFDLPETSPVDAVGRPPLGDLPDTLVNQARTSSPSRELVNRAMSQPSHPAGPVSDPPRSAETIARIGLFDTDRQGRVIVAGRHVGNIDPETGTIKDLSGRPITIATDAGRAIGYLEQPDVPDGLTPTYNSHGELVGHVDADGKAIINGVPRDVAIDADGNLVPFDTPEPPRAGEPPTIDPGRGVSGEPPVTGEMQGGGRVEVEPPTGEMQGGGRVEMEPPTGEAPKPDTPTAVSQGGGRMEPGTPTVESPDRSQPLVREGPPTPDYAGRSGLDIKPRIPVLDADGNPTHYVEPGPREISFDESGNPRFVQRQYRVTRSQSYDKHGNTAPTIEEFDHTVSRHPLTGDDAPPTAQQAPGYDGQGGLTP